MSEHKSIYEYQPYDRVGDYTFLGYREESSGDFLDSIRVLSLDEFVCWHLFVVGELDTSQARNFINLLSGGTQPVSLLGEIKVEPRPDSEGAQTHLIFYGILPGQFLPDQYEPHREPYMETNPSVAESVLV